MSFKKYNYGLYKQEIRKLLRKRLLIKDKVRYHKLKIDEFERKILPDIDEKISNLLKLSKNK